MEISVSRDRDASFEPRIVAKQQRRLTTVGRPDDPISAKGLTHGKIAAHLPRFMAPNSPITALSQLCPRQLSGWRKASYHRRPRGFDQG
ncbi:hypothetical protein [Arthrobacter sp. K5]|uniref:Transposase n=1 Tax=Arthrobacter sp. K5 TaxID=2839623 RepID=A0AAU8EQ17_9MICC